MTNKEAYNKIFLSGFYYYDETNSSIYHYPCDDLHGMFSSGDCNCTTRLNREYISQSDIDKRIAQYEQAQQVNANLYAVSMTLRGTIDITPCNRNYEVKQDILYHVGSDSNYTMYCTEDNIENVKQKLQQLYLKKLDGEIEKAENAKQKFLERINLERI